MPRHFWSAPLTFLFKLKNAQKLQTYYPRLIKTRLDICFSHCWGSSHQCLVHLSEQIFFINKWASLADVIMVVRATDFREYPTFSLRVFPTLNNHPFLALPERVRGRFLLRPEHPREGVAAESFQEEVQGGATERAEVQTGAGPREARVRAEEEEGEARKASERWPRQRVSYSRKFASVCLTNLLKLNGIQSLNKVWTIKISVYTWRVLCETFLRPVMCVPKMGIVKARKLGLRSKLFLFSKMVLDYGNRLGDNCLVMQAGGHSLSMCIL